VIDKILYIYIEIITRIIKDGITIERTKEK